MALDRARIKTRLAEALLDERRKRGHGDPRRFPQPKMAALLDYSLRQYQRLEDADDPSLPTWNTLETILEKLDMTPDSLFGEGVEAVELAIISSEAEGASDDRAVLPQILEEMRRLRAGQDAIGDRLERLEAVRSQPEDTAAEPK